MTEETKYQKDERGASEPLPQSPSLTCEPGALLFGVYRILDRLGEGGMGEVYRAQHGELGGFRAIKVMRPALAGQSEAIELFRREAQALLDIRHEAVVRCHDLLGDDAARVYFLVMELVEGPSLADWVAEKGSLPTDDVLRLGARLAQGLAEAHRNGVVHRDLSPDNIILQDGDPARAMLIDFGISKKLEEGGRTHFSGFKGKVRYASPEQHGYFGGRVRGSSDLYSLGLVLLVAATGEPPSDGEDSQTQGMLEGLDRRLRNAIAPLLERDPEQRDFPAEQVAQWFAKSLGESDGAVQRGKPWFRPWGFMITAAAAAVLTLLVWEAIDPLRGDPPQPSGPPPVDTLAALRDRLVSIRGEGYSGDARLSIVPERVTVGSSMQVRFASPCECDALVFSVSNTESLINLVYPNPFDPAQPLVPGEQREVPSADAIYTLDVEGKVGSETFILLLRQQPFGFPSDPTEPWSTSDRTPERAKELEELLDRGVWDSATSMLHIVD